MKMKSQSLFVTVVALLLLSLLKPSNGFLAPIIISSSGQKRIIITTAAARTPRRPRSDACRKEIAFGLLVSAALQPQQKLLTTTRLSYSNMPPPLLPGGGGGGGGKMDWKALGTSVLSIVGVVVFFASPLGGIFFGIFNSFLLLSILLPFIGVAALQFWQAFNTVQGSCPACGAPIRVVKNKSSSLLPEAPGLCFNCGSIVQATMDNKSIELVQAGPGISSRGQSQQQTGGTSSSFWDAWFGGVDNDIEETIITTRTTTTTTANNNKMGDRFRRENTVIDVDVEDKKNRF
jgi:hypothetical protein